MIAPVFKPLGISAVSASILVFIDSLLLGSVSTLAFIPTFVGPFVPLVAAAWSRHGAITTEDANEVYMPLYAELVKARQTIEDSQRWGSYFPMFQRDKLDPIRGSARYLILKGQLTAVEKFVGSMDAVTSLQGEAITSASRILKEMIREVLNVDGEEVSFQGKTRSGSIANYANYEVPILLVRALDPIEYYTRQRTEILSMTISEKSNAIRGKLEFPRDSDKFHLFWNSAKRKAEEDQDINKVRTVLRGLSKDAEDAAAQVLKKITKSRSIFQ
jgi:hypothetical protein